MPRRKKPRLRRVPRAVAPAAEEAPTEAMELPLPAGPAASQGDDPIVGSPVAMEHDMEPPAAAVDEAIVGPPVAAGAGEFPAAAEADGPPPVPEVPPAPGPPPVPPPLFVVPGPRLPRGEPWAGGRFALARNPRSSGSSAITVTCMLHRHGDRCNNTPQVGPRLSEADCYRRVKEWCLRGLAIPDGPGARDMHVGDLPRHYADVDVRSAEELTRVARAL